MCGKFTTLPGWSGVTDLAELLARIEGGDFDHEEPVTLRVVNDVAVLLFDHVAGARRYVPMRWGFPSRTNPMRPDPIHARAETIDEKPTFAAAFKDGQRGIILAQTFNEGLELPNGKTQQHVITPRDPGVVGIAMLWRKFEAGFCCVMATVPANPLIGGITDRMPAVLAATDWPIWLGETPHTPDDAKACLKTVAGLHWTMAPEEKPRRRPTASDPGGLF